ncbi:MAG: acyl-CoA dehydrogenase family protein, partial [Myxococcales bacterium]
NPYKFDEFLAWRRAVDYYGDDPFLQNLLRHYCGQELEEIDRDARALSRKASFRWRDLAEAAAVPERRPYVVHYDGHRHRIDRIVRPLETLVMEREVFGEKLFDSERSPWVKLVKMFLIYQNGEASIACPLTCTEGLVKLLERYADTPETLRILRHCREGLDGDFAIGAQYLSEIQGGADVPANVLEAVEDGGVWRLYGTKFFCSATHADYVVITAKPRGSETVALFVMPSWLPGDKERECRNGYTVDRIKWKMGTSELTTAELTFHGAVAYPVGPLDRGVANVVGIVLTSSRLTIGLCAAAFMTRAAREARRYTEFREAFGVTVGQFPMVKVQLARIERSARRTVAGAFKLYRDFLAMQQGAANSRKADAFTVRELVMLQKITTALDSTDVIRAAMSLFGGHGVMEDFSSLPRLYRDSAINEQWEGPRNVLLTQIHTDLRKAAQWFPPSAFVAHALMGGSSDTVRQLSAEIEALVAHPSLLTPDEATLDVCARWDDFCHRLFHAYQELALSEVCAIAGYSAT